jgi:hypothetical protein
MRANKQEHVFLLNNKAKLPLDCFGSNVAEIDFEFRMVRSPVTLRVSLLWNSFLSGGVLD